MSVHRFSDIHDGTGGKNLMHLVRDNIYTLGRVTNRYKSQTSSIHSLSSTWGKYVAVTVTVISGFSAARVQIYTTIGFIRHERIL